jgi:hypothetical protein
MIPHPYIVHDRARQVSINVARIIREAEAESEASRQRAKLAQRQERALGLMQMYEQALVLDSWDALFQRLSQDDPQLWKALKPHHDCYQRALRLIWLQRETICNGE